MKNMESMISLLALLSEYSINKSCMILERQYQKWILLSLWFNFVDISFDCVPVPDSSLNRNEANASFTYLTLIANFNFDSEWIFSQYSSELFRCIYRLQLETMGFRFVLNAFNSINEIIVSTNLKLKILSWLSYLK